MEVLMRRPLLPLLAALWLSLSACEEQVYVCQSDANCVLLGVQGLCLPTGPASYCAFPEQQCLPGQFWSPNQTSGCCPSALRWHSSAPMLIENDCVNPATLQAHLGADGGAHPDMMSMPPRDASAD
jgi:hypothetical protein